MAPSIVDGSVWLTVDVDVIVPVCGVAAEPTMVDRVVVWSVMLDTAWLVLCWPLTPMDDTSPVVVGVFRSKRLVLAVVVVTMLVGQGSWQFPCPARWSSHWTSKALECFVNPGYNSGLDVIPTFNAQRIASRQVSPATAVRHVGCM